MKSKFLVLPVLIILSSCNGKQNEEIVSGRFEAEEVIISAEYSGKITELMTEEGVVVEQGDILAVTDSLQLSLQRKRLLATIEAIRAKKADMSKQVSAINQQITYLEGEKERANRLVLTNAGNSKTVDDLNSRIITLERQKEAQISTIEKANNSADKEVESLLIQVAQTEDLIKKCVIRAPSQGSILVKYVNKGEMAVQGKPMFKLADLKKVTLRAYLNAIQISKIKLGDSVKVTTGFDKESTREYKGKIIWISGEAEFTPKSIQTSDERSNLVYAVKVSVINDDYIKIGMYGDLILNGGN